MYYGIFYQNEVSKQVGTFRFDTLTIACVMDWNEFLGGEVVDTNVGTIYNDGSVEFQGSFVYIISEVVSEYDALSRHLISSDTAFIVSPVIHDMLMLAPNGTHEYPQFRNLTNSLRALRSKPPRMRFLLFKLAFCHVLTDMIV